MKISSAIAFMQENLSAIFDAEHFDFPSSQKLPCCKISPNTLSLMRIGESANHTRLVIITFTFHASRFPFQRRLRWTL